MILTRRFLRLQQRRTNALREILKTVMYLVVGKIQSDKNPKLFRGQDGICYAARQNNNSFDYLIHVRHIQYSKIMAKGS